MHLIAVLHNLLWKTSPVLQPSWALPVPWEWGAEYKHVLALHPPCSAMLSLSHLLLALASLTGTHCSTAPAHKLPSSQGQARGTEARTTWPQGEPRAPVTHFLQQPRTAHALGALRPGESARLFFFFYTLGSVYRDVHVIHCHTENQLFIGLQAGISGQAWLS